ncbi:MAG: hypothetical protein J7J06_08240 [Methanosarcinales archaeon]|nr:hypothetical protein [Methanosarcinales archaeon]
MTCYRLQVTDYCPKGVDGVIVAAAHDEFRGMGLGCQRGLWMRGAIDAMAAEQMELYYRTPW